MSDLDRRALLGAASLVGVAAFAGRAKAGPLTPPAGAVTSTGRTTDEIFNKIPSGESGDGRTAIAGPNPFTIVNPGSYVLTGNIGGSSFTNGLLIAADNVTLDLNGFAISSGFALNTGIVISPGLRGITIRNGLVNGFFNGVLVNTNCQNVLIENLLIKEARATGIAVTSARAIRIRGCTVQDTGATTLSTDTSGTITGIALTGLASSIEDCAVQRLFYNGTGIPVRRGIYVVGGSGNTVSRCTVAHQAFIDAAGVEIVGLGVYRDNTVQMFAVPYAGGTDGGGNV